MSLARDKLYRRIEKVLITIESMLVGGFLGFCFSLTDDSLIVNYLGALLVMIIFLVVSGHKRNAIKKERS